MSPPEILSILEGLSSVNVDPLLDSRQPRLAFRSDEYRIEDEVRQQPEQLGDNRRQPDEREDRVSHPWQHNAEPRLRQCLTMLR